MTIDAGPTSRLPLPAFRVCLFLFFHSSTFLLRGTHTVPFSLPAQYVPINSAVLTDDRLLHLHQSMEEPSSHGVNGNGDSGHAARPTGCLAALDNGGSDEPPPIPSASSSSHLTARSVGESRYPEHPEQPAQQKPNPQSDAVSHGDGDDSTALHQRAHALSIDDVTRQLDTSIQ